MEVVALSDDPMPRQEIYNEVSPGVWNRVHHRHKGLWVVSLIPCLPIHYYLALSSSYLSTSHPGALVTSRSAPAYKRFSSFGFLLLGCPRLRFTLGNATYAARHSNG